MGSTPCAAAGHTAPLLLAPCAVATPRACPGQGCVLLASAPSRGSFLSWRSQQVRVSAAPGLCPREMRSLLTGFSARGAVGSGLVP